MEKIESKISDKSANKSVRFSEETDRKFTLLAEKLGRSKQELFGQMVDYFYKSKKDPADLNDEILKKEISKGISRIISFIQTQEKESLAPILAEVREGNLEASKATQTQEDDWNRFIMQFTKLFSYDFDKKTFTGLMALVRGEGSDRGRQLNAIAEEAGSITQALKEYRTETNKVFNEQKIHQRSLQNQKEAFKLLLEGYMAKREGLNTIININKEKVSQLQTEYLARIEKL